MLHAKDNVKQRVSERLKNRQAKVYQGNKNSNKARTVILILKKSSQKSTECDKEKHCLMLKTITHNEETTVKDTYVSSNTTTFKKQKLPGMKKDTGKQF